MASLFQGSPQKATSYTTSSSETPKWMQDAIYNQIQWATNVAQRPYEAYELPRVAELSPLQQQAYAQIAANQGVGQAQLAAAQKAFENVSNVSAAEAASPMLNQAAGINAMAAAQPYFSKALDINALQTAQPYLTQASGINALEAAEPYLTQAAQSSVQDIGEYMNPYQKYAMDVLAKQGARNLSQTLLPQVADQFIKAGSFGGTRMGEFGSRALRDTQEAILNQQALMANQGYAQALQAAQADQARRATIGQTTGSLEAQRQAALANIGQTTGSLEAQRQAALTNIGQTAGSVEAQRQTALANIGQAMGSLTSADAARQLTAAGQLGSLAQAGHSMRTADTAALEAAGLAQQAQMQRELDASYNQYLQERLYPQQQLDWLSTQIRGMAPITPTTTTQSGQTMGASYSPSPLSQLAAGVYTYKGLSGLS